MSIVFAFAPILLLDEGLRGNQALAASHQLVKGRWWQTFFRLLGSSAVTGFLMVTATLVIATFIGLFVGFDKSLTLATTGSSLGTQVSLVDGLQGILTGIIQEIFLPLIIIYQVKIYHSLKKTR